jgi:hypothetical protein
VDGICRGEAANDKVMHRPSYRALTSDEIANPDEIEERDVFDKAFAEKIEASADPDSYVGTNIETPTCVMHGDDDEGVGPVKAADDAEVTVSKYLLPRGDNMVVTREEPGTRMLCSKVADMSERR